MVKKYKITKEQRVEIDALNEIVNRPVKVRFDNEKREALQKLVILHNDIFGTSYEKSNSNCASCAQKVIKNFNKLVNSWQTDKK